MPDRRIPLVVCVSLLAGCLHEASQICRDGAVCPPGLQCVDTEGTVMADNAHQPDYDAVRARARDTTAASGSICVAGTCGNSRLDPGEACDDGNNRSGDGCPADCTPSCGDRVLDPDEVCDDGNTVDGDGCSADCMLRDGVFLVTPSMVSFAAAEGDPLPAAVTVTVRLHNRDTLHTEFPPGVPPAWLWPKRISTGANTAELRLEVTETTVVGERSTTLRLSGSPGGAGLDSFDLPVTYRVMPSVFAVQATPATLAFTAARGDTHFPSRTVSVTFDGDSVWLDRAPAWLTVSGPRATMVSPAPFVVRINNTSFSPGTALSGELVFATTRGPARRTTSVHVDYTVAAELAIAATPSVLRFSAISGGAIPAPQTVEVAFTGARVSCIGAPSWVTVTSPPDPTTSSASFLISINTTSLAGGTVQSGTLVFQTTSGTSPKVAAVQVDYDVRNTPEVQFVAPYLGVPDRGGRLYVRGRGFQAYNRPVIIQIGDVQLGPVNADNDTLIALSYPPLPEGRYPVTLVDPAGVAPRAPELVIAARPSFTYQAIDAPGARSRLVYDAERKAIFGVDPQNARIDHFVYSNGTWSRLPPHAIPQLADIAMAPDGRSLIVVDRTRINEVSLIDGLFTPVVRAPFLDPRCNFAASAAAANNGRVYVSTDSGGAGLCRAYFYDMLDHSLVFDAWSDLLNVVASGDGSRLHAWKYEFGSAPITIYDALSSTITSTFMNTSRVYALSVSDDASRLIVNDTAVYSRSLGRIGNIPYRDRFAALVSRDASRAFVYSQMNQQARLEVYDLHGPLQPGAMYPLLTTVMIPDLANELIHSAMAMTSTPDDTVVFISGADRLLVVPVN